MIDYFATTNQARQDHLEALDKERDKFIAKYSKSIFKAIGDQFEAAASRVEDGKGFKLNDKALAQVVGVIYLDAGSSFARIALKQIAAHKPSEEETEAERSIEDYIKINLGLRIASMSTTIRRIIEGIITEGKLEDLTNAAIAELVVGWWADHGEAKAESLAASETVNASNLGADSAFGTLDDELEQTGRKAFKFWVTTMDGNQRDTHGRANGQERQKDKPFNVGSSKLNFPGDGSLGAGPDELVNCRCGTTFTLR